jgi:hypothetical protein
VPFVTQRAKEKQGLSMEVAPHVVRRHNVEKRTDRQTDLKAEALFGEMVWHQGNVFSEQFTWSHNNNNDNKSTCHKSFSSATFQVMMMMIPRFQTLSSSAICTIQKQLALEENLQKQNPTID